MDGRQDPLATPPIPVDTHYAVFKEAEESIKTQLADGDHYLLLCGLGVNYAPEADAEDSPALPYHMEFGYLESLECAMDEESEEIEQVDWDAQTRGMLATHPLPIAYLDKLYDQTKASLEVAAGVPLTIEIQIVLYGSPLMGYSIGCLCGRRGRRRRKYCYYDKRKHRNKCYCTPLAC
ncbi:MAG: hypothetical protein IT313_00515 [Anaerolineales bacterium]|nr:hypothetical protein [Anaerolineales bacterium]